MVKFKKCVISGSEFFFVGGGGNLGSGFCDLDLIVLRFCSYRVVRWKYSETRSFVRIIWWNFVIGWKLKFFGNFYVLFVGFRLRRHMKLKYFYSFGLLLSYWIEDNNMWLVICWEFQSVEVIILRLVPKTSINIRGKNVYFLFRNYARKYIVPFLFFTKKKQK